MVAFSLFSCTAVSFSLFFWPSPGGVTRCMSYCYSTIQSKHRRPNKQLLPNTPSTPLPRYYHSQQVYFYQSLANFQSLSLKKRGVYHVIFSLLVACHNMMDRGLDVCLATLGGSAPIAPLLFVSHFSLHVSLYVHLCFLSVCLLSLSLSSLSLSLLCLSRLSLSVILSTSLSHTLLSMSLSLSSGCPPRCL